METGELCRLFSTLLSYPSSGYADEARRCLEVTRAARPEAATAMAAFADFVVASPPDRLEELYTAAFDLEPACCPYAGHHLFADPCKRSMMLVRLRQAYGELGFSTGQELPDHVALLVGFLPRLDDEARQEMKELVLGPALEKMAEGLRKAGNPYEGLLRAARLAVAASLSTNPAPPV